MVMAGKKRQQPQLEIKIQAIKDRARQVGHVAGEHAALVFNLVKELNIIVFGEITSPKTWSKRAKGFEYGMDMTIFSDDEELEAKCDACMYVVK